MEMKYDHGGAKHTKGWWGPKAEAKKLSKKARRRDAKRQIRLQLPER